MKARGRRLTLTYAARFRRVPKAEQSVETTYQFCSVAFSRGRTNTVGYEAHHSEEFSINFVLIDWLRVRAEDSHR